MASGSITPPPGFELEKQPASVTPPPGFELEGSLPNPEAPKRSWLDSVGDFAGEMWKQVNPVSAVQGLSQAASHPIQAAKGLMEGQAEIEKKAEAAFKKGDYVEGVRHVMNYLIPVLGQQTDAAGDLAQSGQYAKAAGMTAGIATNIAAPEMIKGVNLKVPVGKIPERLYQSALKPSTALGRGEVKQLVNTGLENQIPISASGAEKLDALITDYGDRVKAEIQSGAKSGATIDPQAVAQRADQLKGKFSNQVAPSADLQSIDATKHDFLANNPNPIPADAAQSMKQGTYQQLKAKAYGGELKSASVEAQKALARGLKEELEAQFPEIKGLNAQQGKFINLDAVLERALNRIDNREIIGMGGPLMAGAGAVVAGPKGAAAMVVMKRMLDMPEFKSRLAFALSKASKGSLSMSAATARVAGYSNALGQAVSQSPGQE